ncbi:hypothetical protein PPL_00982 [Heterostelium album PN500]|uniref:Uncharacterized protein n=1 Tax=Heterostelium pallidum (strain ATCC 26659 / Pp 5 / PN500) TaxID=670386 RepID=D3AXS5_HETP5|nr:hypothetical protein PPL_00982 [Heterostelium album PN500]EFA85752.1 hypothetical protein PPL_00982 [Heterostelium album PN500]|eukprot:XP_020437858.1 hypothetical protein PPL_00982 [Heterostelium album PN500]
MSTDTTKKTERKKPAARKTPVAIVLPSATRTRTITPPKRLGYPEESETATVKRAVVKPKATKKATTTKAKATVTKAKASTTKAKKSATKSTKKTKASK